MDSCDRNHWQKKIANWIDQNPEDFCNEEMMRNYQRNKVLIDLERFETIEGGDFRTV